MKTLIGLALLAIGSPLWARDYPWIDAHLHYVDFMQESEGAASMIAAMDEAGVAQAWVFGLPVVKKWEAEAPRRPRYYLGDEAPLYFGSSRNSGN